MCFFSSCRLVEWEKRLTSAGGAYINRDYAAALATGVPKWFLEPLSPGKNPQKFLFLNPIPLSDGMLVQIPLRKCFFEKILTSTIPELRFGKPFARA
jgi:hypothetical protein